MVNKILLQVSKCKDDSLDIILNEMSEIENRALKNLLYDFLKDNLEFKELDK